MENTNCNCQENIIDKVNQVQDFINGKLLDITKAECSRMNNENERIKNETSRQKAECDRITNENVRQNGYNKIVEQIDKFTESEKRIQQNELERINNENKRQQQEKCRKDAENIRKELESSRKTAETQRITSEINRIGSENNRVIAENKRNIAEQNRQQSELIREAQESTRQDNELTRKNQENSRVQTENVRVEAENTRVQAELTRASNEAERTNAEQVRENSEGQRVGAEQGRASAENARVTAESARAESEMARVAAENERAQSEQSRESAETGRVNAEKARVAAETARAAAETQRTDAESQRETAFSSAKEACEAAASNANAAADKANTEAEKAKAVVEDYKQNVHEHLTIILTTDNDNDAALKGAIVSIKYQNANMETAVVDTLTWLGEPLKTDITAGMMYTVSTSKVSGYDYVTSLENITAIGGYNRSVTLRYANAIDKEEVGQIYINLASGSATLRRKNVEKLNASLAEYLSNGFPCVMNVQGTMMAKIKSATFEGNFGSGMTEGTVTFMDGTICDINALNEKGCNWMVYRPELFFSSWVNETGNEILSFGGNLKVTGRHSFKGKFVGMFKAFNQNGVLKSQPNRIPTVSQAIATFQAQAKAGGKGYGLWNYSDWCKENALHILLFGNTNQETNIGVGRINNFDNVRNIVTGFTLPLVGTEHNYGTRATVDSAGNAVDCLNFLDMEGLGEQIWEFVIGYRHDESTVYLWDDNSWSETHDADRTLPYTISSADEQYIKFITGGEYFDIIPRTIGASSGTGWCDGTWASTSGRLMFVGGGAYNGSLCGPAASDSSSEFSRSWPSIGARLAFYSTPVTVSGAELVASLG